MSKRKIHHGILIGGTPVREPDIIKWSFWMAQNDTLIERTELKDAVVVTQFTGYDNNMSREPLPRLWYETRVTGGPRRGYLHTTATLAEARAAHALVVTYCKGLGDDPFPVKSRK